MSRTPSLTPAILALALGFAALPAAAQGRASAHVTVVTPVAQASAPTDAPPVSRVAPPVLSAAELNAISRSLEGIRMMLLPGGAVGFDAQGRFQDFVTVSANADGHLVFNCVDDANALLDVLAAPVTTASTLEDR